MKKCWFLFIFFALTGIFYGQNDSLIYHEMFQMERDLLLSNKENLEAIAGIPISDILLLLKDFEDSHEWEAGYTFLISLTDSSANPLAESENAVNLQPTYSVDPVSQPQQFSWDLKIGSGYDYTSQDYDIVGIEQDSTIQSVYKYPGINTTLTGSYSQGKRQWQGQIYANSNRYYNIFSSRLGMSNQTSVLKKLLINFYLLKNSDSPEYNYHQFKLENSLGKYNGNWNWLFNYSLQFKDYKTNTEYIYDHWIHNAQLMISKERQKSHWDFSVNYSNLFQPGGKNFDNDWTTECNVTSQNKHLNIEVSPGFRYYNYKYHLSDSATTNVYRDILLDAHAQFMPDRRWIPEIYAENIVRFFVHDQETENDFWYVKLKPGIRYQPPSGYSMGIYSIFEQEFHMSNNELFQQDNFVSIGGGLSFNYMHGQNYILLNYEFIHRTTNEDITSISSYNQPGNIHNILLSYSLQLTERFSLTGMINYDYDRDWKEGRLNSSRIFNVQAVYQLQKL